MKINWSCLAGSFLAFVSVSASAEKGEYWEVTSKMEMPGMPFAMPARTSKVCLPKGGEADPRRTQDKDTKCTFSEMNRSGSTVKYKGTCVNGRGDTVNMMGETSHDSNSFSSKMQMTGQDGGRRGETTNMAMTAAGKRIGGSCDAEELAKEAQAKAQEQRQQTDKMLVDAKAQACDVSNPRNLVTSAHFYTGASPYCSNKNEYCQAVRDAARSDHEAFERVMSSEDAAEKIAKDKNASADMARGVKDNSVVRICGLDMTGLKQALCKKLVHKGPQYFLDKYCPAEAKEYREYARSQEDCKGRGFTSSEMVKACMNLAKCGSDICDSTEDTVRTDAGKSTGSKVDTVLDGAKKLRGLLPF